MYIRAS